jgi:hypothetical protein
MELILAPIQIIKMNNGRIYLTINNIKVKISQQQFMQIINSLDLSDVYNKAQEIYNSVKESSEQISYTEIIKKAIKSLKDIVVNSKVISVSFV